MPALSKTMKLDRHHVFTTFNFLLSRSLKIQKLAFAANISCLINTSNNTEHLIQVENEERKIL